MPLVQNLITSWQALSRVAKHLILILGLILSVVLFGLGCGWFARHEARVWLCQYDRETDPECAELASSSPGLNLLGGISSSSKASSSPSPSASPVQSPDANASSSPTITLTSGATSNAAAAPPARSSPTATPSPTPTPLTTDQANRLAEQRLKVKGLIRHHGRVMSFFYEAYYTAICVLLFAGAFAAIAMFFIAMSGWAAANQYVKTLFVVMTAAAAFYGLWPPVFQQEKNISDNKALFLEYQTLQNEIASYPITRSNVKNEHKEPNDFINYVDSELARIGNIAIGFDYTKISYKGAFESKPGSTPSPSPSATQKKASGGG